jgi:hypothetical protein
MKDLSVASALRHALRYTIGMAVVALIVSNLLPETDAERLATTAYLAVIFAALTLTALHFVSAGTTVETKHPSAVKLPAVLLPAAVVTIILVVGAFFAGQPGTEAILLLVCAALVAAMALGGNALLAAVRDELAGGGVLATLTRYGVLATLTRYSVFVGILVLLLAIVVPADMQPFVLEVGCWAVVAATIFLAASLISRTGLGKFVMAAFKDAPILSFGRITGYAAYACAGALLVAALWPRGGETFAFTAYVAIVIATVGVAIEIRLRSVTDSRRSTWPSNPR